ncbi:E3 ubiquitin-protein ligase MARCHF4-like [Brevipalpus obovatus]|uniref:E3 ubiquitin-protein ligase MARCHF4-like n=1 Tax=Brevipalpus obovatus TaxID=246614 RepID=UPI003D9EA910
MTTESTVSDISINHATCRICFKSADYGSLITPCFCRGVFAYVHSSCLSDWIEESGLEKCDICQFDYVLSKTPKSVVQWLADEDGAMIKQILSEIAVLFAIIYLILLSIIVFDESSGKVPWLKRYTLIFFTILSTFFCCLFVRWTLSCKLEDFHCWMKDHFIVKVDNNPYPRILEPFTPPRDVTRSSGFSRSTSSVDLSEFDSKEEEIF